MNDSASDEHDVADNQGPFSADFVGDNTGAECRDDSANGESRGDELLVSIRQRLVVEIVSNLYEDTRDSAGIVTKEQTTDGGKEGEAPEVETVVLTLTCSLDSGFVENLVKFGSVDDTFGGCNGSSGYVKLIELVVDRGTLAIVGELLV